MPPVVNASFRNWLKSNSNIRLCSESAVTRMTYEGVTNFPSLCDFDKKSIESLPATCKDKIPAITEDVPNGVTAELEIAGANISSISVRRLIVACHASKYYTSIGRTMDLSNMRYTQVLSNFKIEWESYQELRKEDPPTPPLIYEKDGDRKVMKWDPLLLACLHRTYGPRGPLAYVLRPDVEVPPETSNDPEVVTDPLKDVNYYGKSGCLHDELVARLPHEGPIYKNDNGSVYMIVEKAARGTSVESTIKVFARTKDGRGAYQAAIANHAGESKYRSIYKKRMHFIQNIKWNGRSYSLEKHVSDHRQAVDDIKECSAHVTISLPDDAQRVEYLIDSIHCNDTSISATLGLIRANTGGMRKDFDSASSALIEVDPYKKNKSQHPKHTATISGVTYQGGRGQSGVDLRWHHPKEFKDLPSAQKDELCRWQKSSKGRKVMDASRSDAKRKSDMDKGHPNSKRGKMGQSNAKKFKAQLSEAARSTQGFKTIMSVLAKEEARNLANIELLCPQTSPSTLTTSNKVSSSTAIPAVITGVTISDKFPATNLKLNTILNRKK